MASQQHTTAKFAKAAALVGAGALGATILTGVAFAQDTDTDTRPAPMGAMTPGERGPGGAHGERGPGGAHGERGPGGKHGFVRGFDGEVLHSESVVQTPTGTVQTITSVRGSVTAVSDTAITVRASNGYERTFAVNSDTTVHRSGAEGAISSVAVGDVAMVSGVLTGDTATADRVHAMTAEEAAERESERAERRAQMEQRLQDRLDNLRGSTAS